MCNSLYSVRPAEGGGGLHDAPGPDEEKALPPCHTLRLVQQGKKWY